VGGLAFLQAAAYIDCMDNRDPPGAAPGKTLSPAARRALKEAAARRAAEQPAVMPPEEGGPPGPEPTRFGDWERKGVAVDF
jgi:hypothetical protein